MSVTLHSMAHSCARPCHWGLKNPLHILNNSSKTRFIKNLSALKCSKHTNLPLSANQFFISVCCWKVIHHFSLCHTFCPFYHVMFDETVPALP